jgi:CHASE3 domain sensor protein
VRIADRLPLLGLLGALGIGALVATLSYRGTTVLADEGAWVAKRHETIAALERLRLAVYEVDHAARIHALTGAEERDADYQLTRVGVEQDVAHLRELVSADDDQRKALDDLVPAIEQGLESFHETVLQLQKREGGRALALAINLRADEMQQSIQGRLDAMIAIEKGRLTARDSATREDTAALKRAIAAGSATSFLLLIGAFVLLAREADRRR